MEKVVILAGGLGTRLAEETITRPKPMVEIGGKPILWHIMKHYSAHGINDFIICCGYKGYVIKEYFCDYFMSNSDLSINFSKNSINYLRKPKEKWNVTLIDTGLDTMTGGRLARIMEYVKGAPYFCMTYGDGLSNVDIRSAIDFHLTHKKMATVTTVRAPGRFGALNIRDGEVCSFQEKPNSEVNGGFFILSPKVLYNIGSDSTVWEKEPLQNLAVSGQLMAFQHNGFWQPMDTLADKIRLEDLWANGQAPWKVWDD